MASSSKRRASSSKQSSAGKTGVISVRRKDALPRKGSVSADPRKPVVQPPIDDPTEPLATTVAGSNKKAHSLQRPETTASRTKPTRAAGCASGKLNKPAAMEVMWAAAAVVPGTVEVMTPTPVAEKRPAGVVEALAVIAPAVEPEMVTALEPVAETVGAVEPATTTDEVSAMTALEAPEVEALAIVETEVEVEASAIVEETTIVEAFELPVEAVTFPRTAIGRLPVSEETRGPPLARTAAESPAPAAPAPHHAKRALITVVSRLLSTLCRWTGVRQ